MNLFKENLNNIYFWSVQLKLINVIKIYMYIEEFICKNRTIFIVHYN